MVLREQGLQAAPAHLPGVEAQCRGGAEISDAAIADRLRQREAVAGLMVRARKCRVIIDIPHPVPPLRWLGEGADVSGETGFP